MKSGEKNLFDQSKVKKNVKVACELWSRHGVEAKRER